MSKRFVAGTHSYLLSVSLDGNLELIDCTVINEGHHYGIAIIEERDWYVAKNRDDYFDIYNMHNHAKISVIKNLFKNSKHIHQITFSNGGLYFTNTFYNVLNYLPLNGSKLEPLNFSLDGKHTDTVHINSIYPIGNRIYVLLHNSGIRNSEIIELVHKNNRFYYEGRVELWHKGCHNIFFEDSRVFYNASSADKFVVGDLNDQRIVKEIHLDGHTKGLSVLEDYIVIGLSEQVERVKRFSSSSAMVFIERKKYDVVKIIPLKSYSNDCFGNINEIRCLSENDYSLYGKNINPSLLMQKSIT